MNFDTLNNEQILMELGLRLKQTRLNHNYDQEYLADQCGLSRGVIQRLEKGQGVSLKNLIAVLRALDKLQQLDHFIPPVETSPAALYKAGGKERQRARQNKIMKSDESWEWSE